MKFFQRESFWIALAGSVPLGFAVGRGLIAGDWSGFTEVSVGSFILMWGGFFVGKTLNPQQVNIPARVDARVVMEARNLISDAKARTT